MTQDSPKRSWLQRATFDWHPLTVLPASVVLVFIALLCGLAIKPVMDLYTPKPTPCHDTVAFVPLSATEATQLCPDGMHAMLLRGDAVPSIDGAWVQCSCR